MAINFTRQTWTVYYHKLVFFSELATKEKREQVTRFPRPFLPELCTPQTYFCQIAYESFLQGMIFFDESRNAVTEIILTTFCLHAREKSLQLKNGPSVLCFLLSTKPKGSNMDIRSSKAFRSHASTAENAACFCLVWHD